jgi:hypothetical protein
MLSLLVEVTMMKWKRLLLTFMAVYVAVTVLGYVIHALLLASDYERVSHLFRTQPLMPFLLLANASFSLAFVWLYATRVEAKPLVGGCPRLRCRLGRRLGSYYATLSFSEEAAFFVRPRIPARDQRS